MKSFKQFLIQEYTSLGGKELYKYDWRVAEFLKKIESNSPFELMSGEFVTLQADQEVVNNIKARHPTTNLKLRSTQGAEYKLKDLKKNKEFGGKAEGASTAIEDRELSSLNDQINAAKALDASPTIKIRIGQHTYDVYGAETTPGTPKSDFHLLDLDGKAVAWISHKDGKTPKDFQQWGGISAQKEPDIFKHSETQKFIADIKAEYGDGLPKATTVHRKISDSKLKMMSVYGNKFGGIHGTQNVSILLQGPVKLVHSGDHYTITSTHTHINGETLDDTGYEPVLMAIYKGDRSDAGIKGTRVVIAPIACRKSKEI